MSRDPSRWMGVGRSTAADSAAAGTEAASAALGGRHPALTIVFCSDSYDLGQLLAAVRSARARRL